MASQFFLSPYQQIPPPPSIHYQFPLINYQTYTPINQATHNRDNLVSISGFSDPNLSPKPKFFIDPGIITSMQADLKKMMGCCDRIANRLQKSEATLSQLLCKEELVSDSEEDSDVVSNSRGNTVISRSTDIVVLDRDSDVHPIPVLHQKEDEMVAESVHNQVQASSVNGIMPICSVAEASMRIRINTSIPSSGNGCDSTLIPHLVKSDLGSKVTNEQIYRNLVTIFVGNRVVNSQSSIYCNLYDGISFQTLCRVRYPLCFDPGIPQTLWYAPKRELLGCIFFRTGVGTSIININPILWWESHPTVNDIVWCIAGDAKYLDQRLQIRNIQAFLCWLLWVNLVLYPWYSEHLTVSRSAILIFDLGIVCSSLLKCQTSLSLIAGVRTVEVTLQAVKGRDTVCPILFYTFASHIGLWVYFRMGSSVAGHIEAQITFQHQLIKVLLESALHILISADTVGPHGVAMNNYQCLSVYVMSWKIFLVLFELQQRVPSQGNAIYGVYDILSVGSILDSLSSCLSVNVEVFYTVRDKNIQKLFFSLYQGLFITLQFDLEDVSFGYVLEAVTTHLGYLHMKPGILENDKFKGSSLTLLAADTNHVLTILFSKVFTGMTVCGSWQSHLPQQFCTLARCQVSLPSLPCIQRYHIKKIHAFSRFSLWNTPCFDLGMLCFDFSVNAHFALGIELGQYVGLESSMTFGTMWVVRYDLWDPGVINIEFDREAYRFAVYSCKSTGDFYLKKIGPAMSENISDQPSAACSHFFGMVQLISDFADTNRINESSKVVLQIIAFFVGRLYSSDLVVVSIAKDIGSDTDNWMLNISNYLRMGSPKLNWCASPYCVGSYDSRPRSALLLNCKTLSVTNALKVEVPGIVMFKFCVLSVESCFWDVCTMELSVHLPQFNSIHCAAKFLLIQISQLDAAILLTNFQKAGFELLNDDSSMLWMRYMGRLVEMASWEASAVKFSELIKKLTSISLGQSSSWEASAVKQYVGQYCTWFSSYCRIVLYLLVSLTTSIRFGSVQYGILSHIIAHMWVIVMSVGSLLLPYCVALIPDCKGSSSTSVTLAADTHTLSSLYVGEDISVTLYLGQLLTVAVRLISNRRVRMSLQWFKYAGEESQLPKCKAMMFVSKGTLRTFIWRIAWIVVGHCGSPFS